MDPTASYANIAERMECGDFEGARQAAEDLIEWVKQGGFLPDQLARMSRESALITLHFLAIPLENAQCTN